jgi:Fe-S-cluster-containing dehydrogenase component/anaerobic selenocysteine-containing dehydrogenase
MEPWMTLSEARGYTAGAVDESIPAFPDAVSRRRFLSLAGASVAIAGASACTRQPVETILPYVRSPEAIVPGETRHYATACALVGPAVGLLVESDMGRPVKIEGNPDHPSSLGATDAFAQASLLTLYDPRRAQAVLHGSDVSTWESFLQAARDRLGAGEGVRLLTGRVYSPSLAAAIDRFLRAHSGARWHQYEPMTTGDEREGSLRAFGSYVHPLRHFDAADVVVAIDSDFLFQEAGSLRAAREFTSRRSKPYERGMNRLYVAEPTPTLTGAMADHRIILRPSEIAPFTRALAFRLGVASRDERLQGRPDLPPILDAIARELTRHRGSSIVAAGPQSPASVQALVHAMNEELGNQGKTIDYVEPAHFSPVDELASLRDLLEDIERGEVGTLLVLGGNPVYDAPVDMNFAAAVERVSFRAHVGLYRNETSDVCHWHLPEAHFLESWSDARAEDGTTSIVQPLIAPLYAGHTFAEVLSALCGPARTSYQIVRDQWSDARGGPELEELWRRSLHDGVVEGSAFEPIRVSLSSAPLDSDGEGEAPATLSEADLELVFRPDPTIYDGRFSENAWLQELSKPLQRTTWDNVALVSPGLAARLALADGQKVIISVGERSVTAPVWIQPGQADAVVTLHLGYGGKRGGYDAYVLRTSRTFGSVVGAALAPTSEIYPIACTQGHQRMDGRDLLRVESLAEGARVTERAGEPAAADSLYPGWSYDGHAWGMTIDLNRCTGCSACVVACQAENNIPVVGKHEVMRGREMAWLRIDRYYEGDPDSPGILHQPVACVQCENAPCEVVCPVGATVHSSEGLNQMIYNRCVGTRYCSNNCPYKVRRFNFLHYAVYESPVEHLLQNPEVTVRSRGVMEKCTYCIQRIERARIQAETEDRSIRDGEIVTACQQACPAEVIVFGDLNDPGSRVARSRADRRGYELLAELNTRPRTTHLARVRNPNPAIEVPRGERSGDSR